MNNIKKIVIYSVGLLGASIGASFKQAGFTGEIVGISSSKSISDALASNSIDSGFSYNDSQKAIDNADIIFLCSPISIIIDTIKKLSLLNLPKDIIISDVGSTKLEIVKSAENYLPKTVTFIGGHPMAGSEKSGASASDPYLFQNAVFVLSKSELSTDLIVSQFASFLERYLRCRTVILDPKVHDRIAATVSHVPHIVASAMVNFAAEVDENTKGTLDLAAGGFKSLTRIASSPYKMWHDIFESNRDENLTLLSRFIEILKSMHNDLKNSSLEDSFNRASSKRKEIDTNRKGFIGPLHQIVVVAEDRAGFLAKMTTVLSEANINIRDIELLKIREGESGTFMLAFGSIDEAESAVETLNSNNFTARDI